MKSWLIYSKGNSVKCETRKLQYSGEFLGACSVSVTISSPNPINFKLGDWLEYRGERFELNYDPSVIKEAEADSNGEGFVYENVVFNSLSDELTRCAFLDYVPNDNGYHYSASSSFSFFADSIQKLADRIQANLDRIYKGDKGWIVEVHPEYSSSLNLNITANNNTVWDALGFVNTLFKTNFIIRGRKITIGTTGLAVGNLFSYGKGNGLFKIERNADTNQQVITRLRAYGSTRNMPTDYYRNQGTGIPNNMAVKNLMLPAFPNEKTDVYIDSPNIDVLGIREGSVTFDGSNEFEEIYPTMEGMTAEELKAAGVSISSTGALDVVLKAEEIEDDGRRPEESTKPEEEGSEDGGGSNEESGDGTEGEEKIEFKETFTVTLKDLGFDLNDYLSTNTAIISMKDGMCGGRDFEIVEAKREGSVNILTCLRSEDTGLGLYFPYKDYPIRSGDKFVFLNIEMPAPYVKAASQRLLVAAKAYLAKNDYVRYSYTLSVDNLYMARQHNKAEMEGGKSIYMTIKEGDMMLFDDEDLGIDTNSVTISSLTIKEDLENGMIPEYEIILQDEKTVGALQKIQNQITNLSVNGGNSSVNSEQVESLLKTLGSAMFLSKKKDDRSKGTIASDKGLEVGKFSEGTLGSGAAIYKDETNATHIEADYLKIRRKATFTTITVQELKHVGGEIVLSPAAMVCSKVEELETAYKCYFNKKDTEGREVYNDFRAGDFARCQVFNLVEGSKFYWRYVEEADADYIVLSKTYRVGEDIPAEGDNIVQLGNERDTERQNAIILSAYGSDAPSYKQYTGVNRMELTDDMLVTRISPKGNLFKGEFVTKTGSSVIDEIENIKVDWDKILQQTDKEFTMWFYDHAPALDNIPAVEWVTEDLKLLHEEDLFYDTSTGLAYRFTFNGEWLWEVVTDAETIKALEKAAKAQQTADDAVSKINEIAADGILSAVEKKEVYKEWKSIVSMYPIKVASAENCKVSYDDYDDAFDALGKYLNGGNTLPYGQTPKWFSTESIKQNQVIDADEYRQVWINYYDEETALSKAISDKLKEQNDETANDLKDIVSDKMLSALEKKGVLNEWLQILDNYDKNLKTADLLELSGKEDIRQEDAKLTAYKNAFNDLGKYMNGDYDNGSSSDWDGASIPNWLSEDFSENTPIVPEEYRNKWTAYNDAERELVNYFVEKANEKADNAKDEADNANDKIDKITSDSYLSAAEKKDVLKEWQKVVSEVDKDVKNAEYYGLTTEDKSIADYIAAYIYLGEYLNGDYVEGSISHWDRISTPSWLSGDELVADTPINAEEYRSAWLGYYDARIAAKNEITKAIEDYAEEIAGNLDTIVSDGTLSSLEKKEVLKQWLSIVESYNDNLELADYFGATKEGADGNAEYLSYVAAYNNLGTYMNKDENGNQLEWDGHSVPNWLGGLFSKNTEIIPSEYRSVWTAYSSANDILRNKFAELSKSLADKAQGDIDKIVSDTILSAAEKKEVLKEWLSIVEIVDEILAHADEYDVDTTPYINAYHALGEYLNNGNEWTEGTIPSWLGTDYDKNIIIVPDVYRKKWTDYYKEQTAILEAKTDKNKEDIDNIKTDVESIVSDRILSVAEKKEVIKEWLNITAEYAKNISTADNFKLTAGVGERGLYETAYYDLGDYLNGGGDEWDGESLPNWLGDDYGKNTNIIPSEYRKAWSDYYEARTELNNKFSEIAKDKADDAKDEADKANTAINQIIADGVLSAAEKKEVLREWKKVSSAYEINKRNASTYGVSSTSYKNKYEALGTFLNGGNTWKASYGTTPLWLDSENVGVNTQLENPEAYRTAWVDYYDAEITLLDAISSTIKGIADETKEIVSKNFNADGSVKSESGILTTSTSAEIFAQVFEANNVMTEAKMGAYVQVDPETGKIKSKIVITADDVDINNGVVIIDKTSATIGGFTIGADSITGGDTYKMSLIPDNVNGHPSITWSNNLGTTFAEMGVTVMDGYLEEGNVFLRSYRGDKLSLSPSHFEFILDELDGDIRNSSFSFSMSPIGDSSLLFAQTYSSKQHTFEMGMNLGYFRMKSNSWIEAEGLAKTGEVYVKDGYLMVKK